MAPARMNRDTRKDGLDQRHQWRCDKDQMTCVCVDAQSTEQGHAQQNRGQYDKLQQRAICGGVVFHLRVRNSFSGLRSLQVVSVPCSNSALSSAGRCSCKSASSIASSRWAPG